MTDLEKWLKGARENLRIPITLPCDNNILGQVYIDSFKVLRMLEVAVKPLQEISGKWSNRYWAKTFTQNTLKIINEIRKEK